MDVSVIIINYNTCQMTAECIDSVFEKTEGIEFEIILVDNASTDGSREFFEKDKRITYIYNYENLGFGRANNVGIEIAKGRNILFLNSDTLLINNAITILSNYLDENSRVGACGGNLYTKDLKPNHSFRRIAPSIADEVNTFFAKVPTKIIYGKNEEFNHSRKPLSVKYITGADLMIKKSVINNIGVFDPRFFMYYEETELCHRVRKNGYKIMSVPYAEIIHLDGGSFQNINTSSCYTQRNYEYDTSKYIYYHIVYSKIYVQIIFFVDLIKIYTRIILHHIFNDSNKSLWHKKLYATKKIYFKVLKDN